MTMKELRKKLKELPDSYSGREIRHTELDSEFVDLLLEFQENQNNHTIEDFIATEALYIFHATDDKKTKLDALKLIKDLHL